MKLKLNREYAQRHLFVVLLMAGLCCWFGYDGFVNYPSMDAATLYRKIEKHDPAEHLNLEAFKKQKTQTQYGFTLLTLVGALIVGLRLYRSYSFDFEFDDDGFAIDGKRHPYADIKETDRRLWASKGIVVLHITDGSKVKLDSWHHTGVKEFEAKLPGSEALSQKA